MEIFGFVIMRQDEYDAVIVDVLQKGIEYGRKDAYNTGACK